MQTITEFLLARIAEDEAVAREITETVPAYSLYLETGTPWYCNEQSDHVAMAPARVLAECEAKRKIVKLHREYLDACNSATDSWIEHVPWPCDTIKALASVYADHPDYRDEWRG